MKNLHTHLLNVLNEKENEVKDINKWVEQLDPNKYDDIEDFSSNFRLNKDNKVTTSERDILDQKQIDTLTSKTNKVFGSGSWEKLIQLLKSKKTSDSKDKKQTQYDKEYFEKLGKVIVFRTAAAFNRSNGDFTQCVKDIFEHDSDKRIEAFQDVENIMGIAAAI